RCSTWSSVPVILNRADGEGPRERSPITQTILCNPSLMSGPSLALGMTGCERRKPTPLDHPELHPARFADHVLVPRWVPDQLDVGFIHTIDRQNLALGVVGDGRSHSAT